MEPQILQMTNLLRVTLLFVLTGLMASCATHPGVRPSTADKTKYQRMSKVRTTAYTHTERGGRRNAIGKRLSARNVISAASDWSRFPLGTKFRIVGTKDVFQIDDYGTALVGTSTIDLYKTNRLAMRKWGVRHVDIDILEWGSDEQSLQVLTPRKRHRTARRMILALQQKSRTEATLRTF
jgi:3D (Asp-Asp-Asp) domain-containing protein